MANPWGSSPSTNRWKKAGSSFLRARSPDAPNSTTACGSAGLIATLRIPLGAGCVQQVRAEGLQVDHILAKDLGIDGASSPDEVRRAPDLPASVHAHHRIHQPLPEIEAHDASLLHVPPDDQLVPHPGVPEGLVV